MAVMRYDPWRTISQLQNEMNQLFEHRLDGEENGETGMVAADWRPAVDVQEGQSSYTITADLPGVDPKDIDVSLENGVLTIQGERKDDRSEVDGEYKRIERIRGTFFRRFTLPDTADAENVKAKSRNGTLEIVIPKQEKVQPRKIQVEA
ncbi:heat-shock protein Hsp20 [Thiohalorhabdus denitrificans]|uniref:Heat shock protein Hsp20 n=1 Tax=Thiohalorhabdus denitrificans TaxID=381306 RepID=A0A0P9EPA3_9GAMM|nr:Hsp20/alpha crystallin family protein [Thiohalorhabdus denitrificans]KPV40291.1 heat-shock protein Hsp20 [Thiohalorhabdus denitrificans]SCX81000.1 heat shock protein Hsp20 [Thiohalorhabdus denitrificans]